MRHDGLCEYISRAARVELLSLLIESIGSTRRLAKKLGVSHVAVHKWLRPGDAHPSNKNLQKIVELAIGLDSAATSKILRRDLLTHKTSFERFSHTLEW
jgi:TyrR family helix-turn-helix protein